jgi:hypothetical protein
LALITVLVGIGADDVFTANVRRDLRGGEETRMREVTATRRREPSRGHPEAARRTRAQPHRRSSWQRYVSCASSSTTLRTQLRGAPPPRP